MDGMYGCHSSTSAGEYYSDKALMMMFPDNLMLPSDYQAFLCPAGGFRADERALPVFGSDDLLSAGVSGVSSETASIAPDNHRVGEDDVSSVIKVKIASHPWYPRLLQAYIDCKKVGAPPEIACLLDEIQREQLDAASTCLGADPELDEFMETYCDILVKYKSDLGRPFDEATTYLNKVEMQLRNLCIGASIRGFSDEGTASSDEEFSTGEIEDQQRNDDRDLKDRLLRKFGSQISTLKLEFSKKKKKGKLPRDSRLTLLQWWDSHYKWPYPTEADKTALSESTGLDQKQINNWFINQRKRHWKPSESMGFGVLENLSGPFYIED